MASRNARQILAETVRTVEQEATDVDYRRADTVLAALRDGAPEGATDTLDSAGEMGWLEWADDGEGWRFVRFNDGGSGLLAPDNELHADISEPLYRLRSEP